MAVSANRLELLQIADAVAREKVIDREIVIAAMEDAIAKAARSRYGAETDVHAEINPKTGELRLARHLLVVEDDKVENDHARDRPLRTRASATRPPRSATPSPRRCRPSISAASPRSRRSRSSCSGSATPSATAVRRVQGPHRRDRQRHRQARRVRQRHRRPRPRRGHHPPRRDDPARDVPPRRPHPRLRVRRRREARGPQIFLSRTDRSLVAKLFAPGGARDLRRHRRGEGASRASRARAPRSP